MGLVHRRAFMAASAATVVVPNLTHAQTPTANNMAWGTMTRAARDAAYNNSQAVSDSAQIVNRGQRAWDYRTCDYLGLVSRRASHSTIVGSSQCTGWSRDIGNL